LVGLLSRASSLGSELVNWSQEELKRQLSRNGLPELGCDLLGGGIRPVVHSILNALENRASTGG
jgi:hypothetical protein